MAGWIDVSVTITPRLVVWKGEPQCRVEQVESMDEGGVCNLTRLAMSAHTGTHLDAPRHFIRGGAAMEAMPLEAMIGPARVVRIEDPVAVTPRELPADLRRGERILFRTRNSSRDWSEAPFAEDYVYVSKEAARVLAGAGVRTAGIDYLSVGGFHQDLIETHQALLGAGIWVIEGLDLSKVEPGHYEMVCLPLKIAGSDGAPARVVLRPLGEGKEG
jgi:arylformamidase